MKKNFEKRCFVIILACITYLVFVVGLWFSSKVILLPRGHLAVSGDVLGCHDWGVRELLA